MRIGQLARKYNINQDQVIVFLNEAQADLSPFHHNSKVSSDIEDLVIDHFSIVPEVVEETPEVEEETPEVQVEAPGAPEDIPVEAEEPTPEVIELELIEKTEADLQQELDPTLPNPVQPAPIEENDEKTIETDRLLELLEDEDASSDDLSKITHIKAPKIELSGLKVVGRIELAEPKSKSVDKSENQEKEATPVRSNRREVPRLSEEDWNNRRLKAKEKKEQYEAREEKRRVEGEKRKKKAQNKARYGEKIQKAKAAGQAKQKILKEEVIPEVIDQAPEPKSKLGKFWRWFTS